MRSPIFSFSAGEVSPEIAARVDVAKYGSALRQARNVIGLREGGVRNRPGFGFVGQTRNSVRAVRLIPFQFSTSDSYVVELSLKKGRVIRDGAFVTEKALPITAITTLPFAIQVSAAQDWGPNQHVYLSGIEGLDRDGVSLVNGRTFRVDPDYVRPKDGDEAAQGDEDEDEDEDEGVQGDEWIPLVAMDGHPVDLTGLTVASSGNPTAAALHEFETPFDEDDLPDVRYEQSADVMYLAHPKFPLQRLERHDDAVWTIEAVEFKSHVQRPQNVQATETHGEGEGNSAEQIYRVASFNDETGQESLLSDSSQTATNDLTLAGAYNTIWWQAPGESSDWDPPTRYIVYKQSNGLWGYIGSTDPAPSPTGPPDQASDGSTGAGGGTGGGGTGGGGTSINAVGGLDTLAAPDAETGGETTTPSTPTPPATTTEDDAPWFTFKDDNIDPDLGSGPQINADPLSGIGNYAGAIGFYEQRLFLAGTDAKPNGVWGTRSADFGNMNYSRPLRADDALSFGISARQVNRVLHLAPMSDLLAFTSESVFKVTGVGGDPIGPSSISVKPQVHRGAAAVRPLVIDETVLYVTAKGSRLRNLGYQFASDAWQGSDLTVMASHLFRGRAIIETAWVEHPHSAVFCVLDDGGLLCLTWMPEQEVTGWSRLETDGWVESICAVTEDGRDSLYAVIRRPRGQGTWRFVERLALPYERETRKPGLCTTDPAEAKAKGVCCLMSDTGIEHARYLDSAVSYCGEPAHIFSGLEHLEGRTVSALADGNVVHGLHVADGRVVLPDPARVVTVGIPYRSTIRTLPLAMEGGAGKRQGAARAVVRLLDSRGLRIGADPARLEAPKPRLLAGWDEPSDLISGDCEVVFDAAWSSDLGVTIQQDEPLPMTVLGVYPDLQAGG